MQFADWFTIGFGVTAGIACAALIATFIVAFVGVIFGD